MVPEPKQSDPAPIIVNNGATWWQIAVIGVLFTAAQAAHVWWTSDVVPPFPPPAPVVQIDEARSYVTRNGVTLPDADAKAIIAAVKIGDGAYSLVSYPIGEKPVTKQVIIGESKPDVVPQPPKPIDPPKPPDPPKPVDPPPIPVAGFRVLFVVENNPTDPLAIMPKEQQSALASQNVRAYLDRKCAKGPTGTPEWRKFDQHATLLGETQIWKDAMQQPRNVLPWVIVSNGATGYSGPLPENEAALLALLKKYGGE